MQKQTLLKWFYALTCCAAAVLQFSTPAYGESVPVADSETADLWFVEMASLPTADGTLLATVRSEKAAFRAAAQQAGIKYTERYAFDTLWNGLSVKIDKSQVAALARVPGVKNIYPVVQFTLDTESEVSPDLFTALAMTGADIAQSQLGFTGKGIKVGIIDSGIDIDHLYLGGNGVPGGTSFPSARVAFGYDFVGDAFNADGTSPGYNPVPVPDPNPDDCAGHGTHVAGIVGANGPLFKGVAPEVTFGAYRVFGCAGSTYGDIMIAAMEMALRDGMQVVNMSIGSSFQWPQYPTAQASDRLVNKGVVVVASIGNSGANGLYSAGAPGVGKKVIGVASYDNTHVALNTFTVSPDNKVIGYTPATGAPLPPTSGTYPITRTGTTTTTDDGCAALPTGSLTGQAVLIRRGTCTFYAKAMNAQNAGAVAVILYNNATGRFNPTVVPPTASDPPVTIPVVAISNTEGALIDGRIAAGDTTITWTDQVASFPSSTGGLISSFSSYGLAPDLSLKPDLGAPGGNIYSTYPLELGGFASMGGTSMSSPHVAGAVALLLEAKPKTPAQAVGRILQNSADPHFWWGNPGLGYLDNVHRQGAGMLDIDDAILATTRIEPGKLALGESEAGPVTSTLKIENVGATDVTYDLSYTPAVSTGPNTFTVSFMTGFADVGSSASSVTVPAHGMASVDVTITANAGLPDRSLYGGYVFFAPQDGGQAYSVPFAGFKGDYQTIQALAPTAYAFPWLAKVIGASLVKQIDGATFTLAGDDLPYILVHLDHPVARLRVEVCDAKGKAWHRALDETYVGRNSTATGFFALAWDGMTFSGRKVYAVPDGAYVMKLSVLKALGDENNPAHWEAWTSPVFIIDRP